MLAIELVESVVVICQTRYIDLLGIRGRSTVSRVVASRYYERECDDGENEGRENRRRERPVGIYITREGQSTVGGRGGVREADRRRRPEIATRNDVPLSRLRESRSVPAKLGFSCAARLPQLGFTKLDAWIGRWMKGGTGLGGVAASLTDPPHEETLVRARVATFLARVCARSRRFSLARRG